LRASLVPCLVGGLIALGLTAWATWAFALERGALWQVVRACVADQRLTGSPFPCLEVDLTGGEEQGSVVLRQPFPRDTILAPTRRIIGVEDPFLYSPEAPNYFAAAWRARTFLDGADGKPPERDRIALAVNSRIARNQDQLHIHIGCLVPPARNAVQAIAPRLRIGEWAQVGAVVPHSMFWGLRIQGADLAAVQPFRLAADYLADKARNRADIMIVVAATRVAGDDEFLILATYAHAPHSWWVFGAEDLLDPSCSTASDLPGEAAPSRHIGGAGGRQAAAFERWALTLLR
jgi:CDP-diacylglycerol pyrophosphatase